MRRLVIAALLVVSAFAAASAQTNNEIPNMGRAPKQADGIGRLDLRVLDQDGNPVQGVRADLKSKRGDGFLCESWNWTNAAGVAVLPPLHMGKLTLKLSAKGFQTQTIQVDAASLNEPVRVTLVRKS
jgi:uncharacterized protein YccT (UPF0319 family)